MTVAELGEPVLDDGDRWRLRRLVALDLRNHEEPLAVRKDVPPGAELAPGRRGYVREFLEGVPGMNRRVSQTGATNPRWRKDGKELFFAALDGTIQSVDVTSGSAFQASAPRILFRVPSGILPNWDVTADGKRFLLLVQQDAQAPFTVWQNWQAALKE